MNRMQRAAVIVSLIQELKAKDSWCGETNIQKACYFLQELSRVPLGLRFVLYRYGPYSFELTDELTAMCADGILALQIRDPRYGPCYVNGELASHVLERFPKTVAGFKKQIGFVAEELGSRKVADLERVATALYVRKGMETASTDERADKIIQLKPHISRHDAHAAVKEVDRMFHKAEQATQN